MKLIISVEVEAELQLEQEGISGAIASLINNNDDLGVAMEVTSIEKEVVTVTKEKLYPLETVETI